VTFELTQVYLAQSEESAPTFMYFGIAKIDACRFVPDNEQRFTTFEFANIPKASSEIIEDFRFLRIRHCLRIVYHHWPGELVHGTSDVGPEEIDELMPG
jgi:hypothetical protein